MPLHRRLAQIAAFLLLSLVPAAAGAGDVVRIGDIRIEAAWARASIGASRPGVAYLSIVNAGGAADTLTGARTPAAERAVVHQTVREGGVMKMRPAPPVVVPAGGSATLEPGGLHLMLMGLRAPLHKGESFPLTLTFEHAGSGTVTVRIAGPGAMAAPR